MKENYNRSINLRCVVCASESFSYNDDQSYVKCKTCGREYFGGYDELVQLNEEFIEAEISDISNQIKNDFQKEINKIFSKWK